MISSKDVLSAALYPKVFDEYMTHVLRYSDLVEKLPTRAFLAPLEEDEEVEVEVSKGVAAVIKYKATGELQTNGKREVFFEANGVPRVVEVVDKKAEAVVGRKVGHDPPMGRGSAERGGGAVGCVLALGAGRCCKQAAGMRVPAFLPCEPRVSEEGWLSSMHYPMPRA